MPSVSSPQWAPDGKRIAYVVTKADLTRSVYDSDVWVIDVDGANDRRLTFANGTDNRPRWSPDGTRMAFLSDRGGRNAIYVIDPRGGEARLVSDEPTPVREFEWSPHGKEIAFIRIDETSAEEEKRTKEKDDARVVGENVKHVRLHVVDVESGKSRRLTNEQASIFGFGWSPDGKTIAFDRAPRGASLDDMYRTDLYTIPARGGEAKPLVTSRGLDRGPTYSPDGKWIAFTSTGDTGHWIAEHDVYVVPAAGGTPRKISSDYGRTPDAAVEWSDDSKAVYVQGPWNTSTQLFRINVDGSGFTNVTNVTGVAQDADVHGERFAYVYQSFTAPPELFLGTRQLTNHNAAYRNRDLGTTRIIRWKNPQDGLEIDGLLTLPVGYKGGRVPLLTFVHGGPASRFDEAYLGYLGHVYAPQALAAAGYAVLRPNPRGTGGYGAKFRAANRADWAGLDWLDINAGIDQVIADGIGDPSRLGLMGWSYGGYIASWALGHSDRFRAISIGAPVTDLLSFHGTTDIRDFIPSYFEGMPRDLLRARSPLWHLKKTDTKVLIQHGEIDERVPLSQGTMLYRLLDELGTDVQMVVYPRTRHVPFEPKLRIDIARRNLEFFKRTIQP